MGEQFDLVRRKSAAGAAPGMVEALESRLHLSAPRHHLRKGKLTVTGTAGNDAIVVSLNAADHKKVDVSVNGRVWHFRAAAVKQLIVVGGAGDDQIILSDANGAVPGSHELRGGAGNDTIRGDAGDNTIDGGPGADNIDPGFGGRNTVVTDANDTILNPSNATIEKLDANGQLLIVSPQSNPGSGNTGGGAAWHNGYGTLLSPPTSGPTTMTGWVRVSDPAPTDSAMAGVTLAPNRAIASSEELGSFKLTSSETPTRSNVATRSRVSSSLLHSTGQQRSRRRARLLGIAGIVLGWGTYCGRTRGRRRSLLDRFLRASKLLAGAWDELEPEGSGKDPLSAR
jgi:hypothetical protein